MVLLMMSTVEEARHADEGFDILGDEACADRVLLMAIELRLRWKCFGGRINKGIQLSGWRVILRSR